MKEGEILNDWIIENLNNAFATWNEKLGELWTLAATSPENFKGRAVWGVMLNIHGTLLAVGYGMEIMLKVFAICNGIVGQVAAGMGGISQAMVALPAEIEQTIGDVGFLASIPLWLVTILGSLFITVLSFVMILTVYGRFFRLYMYTALAPVPLSTFAGESTQSVGVAFLKTYVGVCMEGAVIVLACIIYSGFVSTPVVTGGAATSVVWSYLAETVFNMLVLVGLIKGSDRIIHEMMGL